LGVVSDTFGYKTLELDRGPDATSNGNVTIALLNICKAVFGAMEGGAHGIESREDSAKILKTRVKNHTAFQLLSRHEALAAISTCSRL